MYILWNLIYATNPHSSLFYDVIEKQHFEEYICKLALAINPMHAFISY